MLIEFTIENFRSIKESTTFSMQTAPYLKRLKDSNTLLTEPINLLKSSIIFGANGSGKTNLIRAIETVRLLLLNYERKPMRTLNTLPFQPFKMIEGYEDSYTLFELTFYLKEDIYKYTIKYNDEKIYSEALYLVREEDVTIFERDRNNNDDGYIYNLGEGIDDLKSKTRDTSPYLSVLADNNNKLAMDIVLWVLEDILIIGPNPNVGNYKSLLEKLEDKVIKNKLINFLKIADFNIVDFELRKRQEKFPAKYKEVLKILEIPEEEETLETIDLFTIYKKYNKNNVEDGYSYLDVDSYESRGTQKMIIISLILIDAFENGKTIFIDEFDNAFHLEISQFLLKLFNSNLYNNNSQFIMNTHDLSLMDSNILRVDQVWFVEKDIENKSEFYSLYDFNDTNKKARSDMSYAKDYLKGKFGAVPIINESVLTTNIFNERE
ncbi:AAA family ATPase [Virgibacillus halodenitrificans]|uniref:AAA family ATPase n=1 Tax=Virgibacillus halodenitrificans TaxID=1482 RepID=UPI001FB253C4|nr:ATP-binding protein [Virgibacillus halodenitrificans]MCJ0932943.1 AAA family ATPase [Virgibacillus halodenitrificans]